MVCIISYDSIILRGVFGMAFFIDFSMLLACPQTPNFLETQAQLKRLFFHYLKTVIAELALFSVMLVTYAIWKRIMLHGLVCSQCWHNN